MSTKINWSTLSEIKLSLIKDRKIIFKNFEDFNIYLVNYTIKISILDYIKCVHLYFFKNVNLDLLSKFLNYCKDDQQFNIGEDDMKFYNLLNDNISIDSLLETHNLILDKDYRIRKINNKNCSNLEYKFTSRALKRCLLKTNIDYIDYYLLIENCVLHYTNYQTSLYNKLGFIKDLKLDTLIKNYENQNEKIDKVFTNLELLTDKNNKINNNINFAYKKITDIIYNLAIKDLNNSKIDSKFTKIINTFAIYKINTKQNNKLYYIDCDTKLFPTVERMIKLEYNQDSELLYKIDYNIKHINILSKLINKFDNNIEINKYEITLLSGITYNNIITYLKELI